MPYFERKTTSGKLVEVERYFATRDGKRLPRAGNESESTEEQQKLNERHAQKRLMRLINANFDGEAGDQFVTFTHAEDISEKQARKEARNLIDRLDRLREEKEAVPLEIHHRDRTSGSLASSRDPERRVIASRIGGRMEQAQETRAVSGVDAG